MVKMEETLEDKLLTLCIDILAHSARDYEITLQGNGYNAFECEGVAFEILDMLGIKNDDIDERVKNRMSELQKFFEEYK